MKSKKYYYTVSIVLVLLSLIMFYIHYLMFGQLENTIYYSLMSLCFIPINILAVTVVFENLMEKRARQEKISKMNMLVGVFFTEIGFKLMDIIVKADKEAKNLRQDFEDEDGFKKLKEKIKKHNHEVDINKIDFRLLEKTLVSTQPTLMGLISNENILEHEKFADLLMATLHLRDEVVLKTSQGENLKEYIHIEGDIKRVYVAITSQWIDYLYHLKVEYPYLYKTAMEINAFNK